MAKTPEDYSWSSYCAIIGKKKKAKWLETKWLLSQFGRRQKEAIRYYKDYVEGIETDALEDPHKDVVGGLILGDTGFVNWVKEALLSVRDDEQQIRQIKKLKPSLETIVRAVCDEMRCSEEQILEKGPNEIVGREMAIFLARDFSGISHKAQR